MSHKVVTVSETTDITEVIDLMVGKRIKSLPVMRGDRIVGMISRRDLMAMLARPDDELRQAVTGDKTRIATTGIAVLAAGDYVECGIYQNSGATLAVDAGSYFSLTYLGA